MSEPREWDAQTYHAVSTPQHAWGRKVLERLPLAGDELVVDAGCGSGRLTAELLERLPRGRVIAVDASRNMLAKAAETLARFGDRVELLQADLADLSLGPTVDAVFSTATFHWIPDHPRLFAALFRALRPGGLLVAQCGGGANLARVHARAEEILARPEYAPHVAGWTRPWNFADVETTKERLLAAGFEDVRTWLEPAPTTFETSDALRMFLANVVLAPHLGRLPDPALRERLLGEIVVRAAKDDPPFTLDYWRLNLDARRPRER